MNKAAMAFCVAALFPVGAVAGGPHDDHHHHHETTEADRHDHDDHTSVVGEPADAGSVDKTLHVDLLDTMRFVFDQPLQLRRGEVIRFVVSNRGQIRHEFSIGSASEQESHRVMMRDMPNMVHEDPNAVTVEPGETKELIWRFKGDQAVVFACNIPGHSEAGMVATAPLQP